MGFRAGTAAAIAMVLATAGSVAQSYKVVATYKAGSGAVQALAVDSQARRLYVGGADGVTVLNLDTGAPVGSVVGVKSADSVLVVPGKEGDEPSPATTGYAVEKDGRVVAFSLASLKVISAAKLETPGAASLCYDPFANTVEAVSSGGSLATLEPESGKLLRAGKVATGKGEVACGFLNQVYVADPEANVIHVLNHQTLKVEGDFPIKSGHKPTGVSLDPKGRRLFVSCEDGTIEVIDTDAGFTFIELQGGTGPAREVFTYLPQGKGQWKAGAFIAQQDGTLTGVRMMAFINYIKGGSYPLGGPLGAIAYDAKTHHLLIASQAEGAPAILVAGY